MAHIVTRSKPNRASLLEHEHVVELELRGLDVIPQISNNCKMLSYQYGPTFLKNAFRTLLNQCHVQLREFWRWKGVKYSI